MTARLRPQRSATSRRRRQRSSARWSAPSSGSAQQAKRGSSPVRRRGARSPPKACTSSQRKTPGTLSRRSPTTRRLRSSCSSTAGPYRFATRSFAPAASGSATASCIRRISSPSVSWPRMRLKRWPRQRRPRARSPLGRRRKDMFGPGRRMVRRRTVARAAVVGGTAYYAGKKGAQSAQREADQEARLEDLEAQQAYGAPPPPAYAAPPPPPQPSGGGGLSEDSMAKLQQLAQLHEQGILTDAEFEVQKQKILQGM